MLRRAHFRGTSMVDMTSEPIHPAPRAVRVVFAYDGDDVTVIDQYVVETVQAPSDPVEADDRHGFWIDLRSADGGTLARRVLRDPFLHSVEVHPDPDTI